MKKRTLASVSLFLILVGLAASPLQAALVADSVADFSTTTQGEKGWYYGGYTSEFDYNTFQQYGAFGTGWNSWYDSAGTLGGGFITQEQAVPGLNGGNKDAVRRWVSTVTGTITISGLLQRAEAGPVADWNNGVRSRILVNGNTAYDLYIPGQDTSGHLYQTDVAVSVGDKVDFVIDPYYNNGCDRTTFTAQITPEPATLSILALGLLGLARRKK